MPYKKNYRRRRYPRKSDCLITKKTAMSYARKAYSGVKYLKTLVNAEKKFVDKAINLSQGTTANSVLINGIEQGDAEYQRDGLSVLMNNVQVKGTITKNASATSDHIRMVIVKDNQQIADATTLTFTDVFSAATMDSYLKRQNVGRFTILSDRVITLTSDAPTVFVKKYFKQVKHTRFNGTLDTDIQKDGIYVLFVGTEAVNTATIDLNARVAYYDN